MLLSRVPNGGADGSREGAFIEADRLPSLRVVGSRTASTDERLARILRLGGRLLHARIAIDEGAFVAEACGVPVHHAGRYIGMLRIAGARGRAPAARDLEVLKDLAALVEAELEREDLEQRASIDALTRVWNRGAIIERLAAEVARAQRGGELTAMMIDVDNFKLINDTHGHAAGDCVLEELAVRLRGATRDSDFLGRYGGEEFVAVLGGCGVVSAPLSAARILSSVSDTPIQLARASILLTVSVGYASYGPGYRDARQLLEAADAALYRAKAAGKNCALPAAEPLVA
jgi:diguanylate cyclase (GGDEF)-like protein